MINEKTEVCFMKRVLSLVLCLILIVLPLSAFAETDDDAATTYLVEMAEIDKMDNLQQ